jgi:hypothetical protein
MDTRAWALEPSEGRGEHEHNIARRVRGRSLRARTQVVRRKHFRRVRAAIAARLLVSKENFQPALREIQGHVADLRSVSFCAANASHLHTLQGTARRKSALPAHGPAADPERSCLGRLR